jgi:hypothetical protein
MKYGLLHILAQSPEIKRTSDIWKRCCRWKRKSATGTRLRTASGMRRCRESCVSPDLRGNAPLGVGSRSSQLRGISVSPHDNGVPEWLSFSSSPAACMPPCINQETTTVMFWPFGVRMQSSPSDALTSTDALRTTGSDGARPDLRSNVAHPRNYRFSNRSTCVSSNRRRSGCHVIR